MAIILRIEPKYKQYEMKPCKHFSSNGTFLYKNMIRVIDYCSGHNYCDMYLFLYTYIGVDGREQITFNLWKLMPFINKLASKGPKIAAWLNMYATWNSMSCGQSLYELEDQLYALLHKWSDDTERDDAQHTMNFFIRVVHRCGLNKLADEREREFDIARKYEIRVLHCSRNYCKEVFILVV